MVGQRINPWIIRHTAPVGLVAQTGHCLSWLRWSVARVAAPMSPQQHQNPNTPAVAVLAAFTLAVGLVTANAAQAGDYQQSYSVVRDAKGQRAGTIQCDGITDQCVTYDTRGQRTGTIEREGDLEITRDTRGRRIKTEEIEGEVDEDSGR